jgi:hypothetical protein
MVFKKGGGPLFTPDSAVQNTLRRALLNNVSLPSVDHFINADATPQIPSGWSIEEHKPAGLIRWHPSDVALWSSAAQQQGAPIVGTDLRAQLEGRRVLNATVMDYLFDHPDLIPPDWEGQCVFFWGTIYRRHGGLAVRALALKDGILNSLSRRLHLRWFPGSPAAVEKG